METTVKADLKILILANDQVVAECRDDEQWHTLLAEALKASARPPGHKGVQEKPPAAGKPHTAGSSKASPKGGEKKGAKKKKPSPGPEPAGAPPAPGPAGVAADRTAGPLPEGPGEGASALPGHQALPKEEHRDSVDPFRPESLGQPL